MLFPGEQESGLDIFWTPLINFYGVESYYVVLKITNFSSETSSYAINVALVCDGRKKFEDDFLISRLLPSETKSESMRVSDELRVDRCTATVSVSLDAS
jgi:hypothetical protein